MSKKQRTICMPEVKYRKLRRREQQLIKAQWLARELFNLLRDIKVVEKPKK